MGGAASRERVKEEEQHQAAPVPAQGTRQEHPCPEQHEIAFPAPNQPHLTTTGCIGPDPPTLPSSQLCTQPGQSTHTALAPTPCHAVLPPEGRSRGPPSVPFLGVLAKHHARLAMSSEPVSSRPACPVLPSSSVLWDDASRASQGTQGALGCGCCSIRSPKSSRCRLSPAPAHLRPEQQGPGNRRPASGSFSLSISSAPARGCLLPLSSEQGRSPRGVSPGHPPRPWHPAAGRRVPWVGGCCRLALASGSGVRHPPEAGLGWIRLHWVGLD